jgi:hypothetical protein
MKIFFSLCALMIFGFQYANAHQHGNESGPNVDRNIYEYNLYDRNYDRLRGQGIYDEEDDAYPKDYNYLQESLSDQATESRRFQ